MVERNIPYDMTNVMILKEILSTTTFNQGEWSAPMPACKQVPCPPIISLVRKKIIICKRLSQLWEFFWSRDNLYSLMIIRCEIRLCESLKPIMVWKDIEWCSMLNCVWSKWWWCWWPRWRWRNENGDDVDGQNGEGADEIKMMMIRDLSCTMNKCFKPTKRLRCLSR